MQSYSANDIIPYTIIIYKPALQLTVMKQSALLVSTILALSLFYRAPVVQAVTPPDFPACANPQGTLQVSYEDGIHGIAGKTAEYKGSDSVYKLGDTTWLQCFCSQEGEGIQTNWWKVSSLTEDDIQILKNQGWSFIPTGALWGLDDEPYMAKNAPYACTGKILASAASTAESVLGLASTGNISLIYGLASVGAGSLFLGILARKRRKE